MILDDSYQAPNCNSFPKIFGSSGHDTYINQIDMFADYLAMVGKTLYPFIAVASVAIPDKFYCAKELSLKGGTSFDGV